MPPIMPSLATLSARVTGFNFASHHTYTTVVTLDGVSWTLAIRYSKFLAFYDQLRAAERSFKFDFPPKSGFFSTPKPEDRKPRLDAFLQAVTAFYLKRKQPRMMTKLLREFLQVDKKLRETKNKTPLKPKAEEKKVVCSESTGKEAVEKSKAKEDAKTKPKGEKTLEPSVKAQEGKKALVSAACEVALTSAIKDNTSEAKTTEKKGEAKEIKVQPNAEEKVVKVENEKVLKVEEKKVEVEKKEEVIAAEKKEKVIVEETKVEEKKEKEVKAEKKKEETEVEEPKAVVEQVVAEEVKNENVKPTTTSTTTTKTTTTTTTTGGSTVVETNVTSQPTASKTVVGKTVTVTSNSDDPHSFKVEMTEKKASVVTHAATAKEMVKAAEQKGKKKRSNRKKSVSKAPLSTASTASDGFESPDGVDDVSRVSYLSETQKKARNQRRKEKRKKNQKKIRTDDLKA